MVTKSTPPARDAYVLADLEKSGAVKRSPSGKLSVSISDVAKTESFQQDLKTIGRIRRLLQARTASR